MTEMFNQSILHFKNQIEGFVSDDESDMSSKYEIIIPYALRGLIIHLMNDNLDRDDYQTELSYIV
jgi:hypothetical protein